MGGYQKFKTERLYSDILDAFDIKEKPLLYSSWSFEYFETFSFFVGGGGAWTYSV